MTQKGIEIVFRREKFAGAQEVIWASSGKIQVSKNVVDSKSSILFHGRGGELLTSNRTPTVLVGH